jgi:tetratricopeptide (TPR) repeat protein
MAVTATACNDWLSDPRPLGDKEDRDMYSSEEGFRNVLMGVYIRMSDRSLYGRNMSMVLPEMFAQHWNITNPVGSVTMEQYAKDFDFESSSLKSAISNAWANYFGCIVNLNSLLKAIDEKRELFNLENYNLIKGEALGLRAFLHFEVLRFWGPVPAGADISQMAIPYVKEMTNSVKDLISIPYEKVLMEILADLNEAEKLLKNDPITRFSRELLTDPGTSNTFILGDDFYYYRNNRFNFYAVKATKARYYLWVGDKDKALEYAEQVIDAVIENTSVKVFELGDEKYIQSSFPTDLLLSVEHIFAVYNNNLSAIVDPLYRAAGLISQVSDAMNTAYEGNVDEIRWKTGRYWNNVPSASTGQSTFMFNKYITADYKTSEKYVPVIRLSEMYLIAMECAGSSTDAKRFFEPYRIARNLHSVLTNDLDNAHSTLERLEKEYRKDFLGEGQMFYFYKRHGKTNFTWPLNFQMIPQNYVIPKPDKQITFE